MAERRKVRCLRKIWIGSVASLFSCRKARAADANGRLKPRCSQKKRLRFALSQADCICACRLVFRHGVVNLVRPGGNAAFDALEIFEALLAQELKRFHRADT